jgi:hypothetical protein
MEEEIRDKARQVTDLQLEIESQRAVIGALEMRVRKGEGEGEGEGEGVVAGKDVDDATPRDATLGVESPPQCVPWAPIPPGARSLLLNVLQGGLFDLKAARSSAPMPLGEANSAAASIMVLHSKMRGEGGEGMSLREATGVFFRRAYGRRSLGEMDTDSVNFG